MFPFKNKFLGHRHVLVLNIWKFEKLEKYVDAKQSKCFSIMIIKLLVLWGPSYMFLVHSLSHVLSTFSKILLGMAILNLFKGTFGPECLAKQFFFVFFKILKTSVSLWIFVCFVLTWGHAYRERGREGERDVTNQLPFTHEVGEGRGGSVTQACALTRNWTLNLLVCGTTLQPTESPGLGKFVFVIIATGFVAPLFIDKFVRPFLSSPWLANHF